MSFGHNNQILLGIDAGDLPTDGRGYLVTVSYKPGSVRDEKICLYDVMCHGSSKPVLPQVFTQASHTNIYKTKVKYSCGPGKGFNLTNGNTRPSLELECDEHGNWTQDMRECICETLKLVA